MRKAILSLALILVTSVAAGENKQPYHLNVHTGLNVFDDESHLENGSLIGASATFYERETESYALQLGYERLSGINYEGIILDTDIDRYYINMIVDGDEELSITPYILLGGGYEHISRIYEEYTKTKSQGFLNAGLGFKYRLNDYFNITLEARAMGMLDSESVDYVSKLGLDFMFGGKWQQKAPVIEALGEPMLPKSVVVKPVTKIVKKKKKWITPEVVEEMFSEKEDTKAVEDNLALVREDATVAKMKRSLKSLKIQMAESEARLALELKNLESELKKKNHLKEQERLAKVQATKRVAIQKELESEAIKKEQQRLLALEKDAKAAHKEKMRVTQEKIAKAQERAKALKEKKAKIAQEALEQERQKKAKVQREAALAKQKELERIAKIEKEVQKKALAEKRRLEAIRVAEQKAAKKAALEEAKRVAAEIKAAEEAAKRVEKEARIAREKELAEYKRLQALQEAEEKKAAEIAQMKAAQEQTDTLFVRNGMVVFAD